ncbi:MAG: sensor histidine kinase [Pseudomonadota bacterium]
MKPRVFSLRARLTAIILLPLMIVAALVGAWQLTNARQTATGVFDRSLLSAALAVAGDVVTSGGDALSPRTRDILNDTSGGQVFYHVYAPDGVIVAGYATPPAGIPNTPVNVSSPTFFEAVYFGRPVHGVRLENTTQIDGFTGIFTTTVWQDRSVREAFVQDLVTRSIIAISGLMAALALIVWFGVRIGLRPLIDLETAIARRSSDDLSPIQRAVPKEVEDVVGTLNRLFGQVSRSMTAQADFISNAAHQLRNPIAGVLSLAEAVRAAPTFSEAQTRSDDLLEAARETAQLSQKLLLLERTKNISPASSMETFDLSDALSDWVADCKAKMPSSVILAQDIPTNLGPYFGDFVMLREAVTNLIDNAVKHGGANLNRVTVSAARSSDFVQISVQDNGIGVASENLEIIRERFRQVSAGPGTGLGVSIVDVIARAHGGTLDLCSMPQGLQATIRLGLNMPSEKSDSQVSASSTF